MATLRLYPYTDEGMADSFGEIELDIDAIDNMEFDSTEVMRIVNRYQFRNAFGDALAKGGYVDSIEKRIATEVEKLHELDERERENHWLLRAVKAHLVPLISREYVTYVDMENRDYTEGEAVQICAKVFGLSESNVRTALNFASQLQGGK